MSLYIVLMLSKNPVSVFGIRLHRIIQLYMPVLLTNSVMVAKDLPKQNVDIPDVTFRQCQVPLSKAIDN